MNDLVAAALAEWMDREALGFPITEQGDIPVMRARYEIGARLVRLLEAQVQALTRVTPLLLAAWAEVLAEVGPGCEMDHTWCRIHRTAGRDGRCATGRALVDMANELEALGLITAEGTHS